MADLQGTNVAAPVRPYNTECTYPTALADEIAGGLKYVENESALATITPERRPVGTIVSVGFGKFRQWTGSDWRRILQGADPPKVEYTNSDVQLKFTETVVSLKAATANSAGILSSAMFSRLTSKTNFDVQTAFAAGSKRSNSRSRGWLMSTSFGLFGSVFRPETGSSWTGC